MPPWARRCSLISLIFTMLCVWFSSEMRAHHNPTVTSTTEVMGYRVPSSSFTALPSAAGRALALGAWPREPGNQEARPGGTADSLFSGLGPSAVAREWAPGLGQPFQDQYFTQGCILWPALACSKNMDISRLPPSLFEKWGQGRNALCGISATIPAQGKWDWINCQ